MDKKWQGSVRIAAPVEEVYRYLADFPRHCEWAQTLERMEEVKPGGETGVGATYRTFERQAMQSNRRPRAALTEGFKGKTMCEVRELVPNEHIAWHAYALPKMGIHADLSFDLVPDADGTILTQHVTMHQPGLPTFIFRTFVFKMSEEEFEEKAGQQWQASLRNIKEIMEEARTDSPLPALA